MELSLSWQRQAGTPSDTLALEWVDAAGAVAAEQPLVVAPSYPPSTWREGEVVKPRYSIVPPPTLDPGAYRVRLTASDAPAVELGRVTLAGPPRRFEPGPIQHPLAARLGQTIALLGYDVTPSPARSGQLVRVTLHWRASGPPTGDYKHFLHLVDAAGQIHAQADSQPVNGSRPTTGWVEGEVVADPIELALPPDLPPGRYRLLAGLYDATTLARLPALTQDGAPWPNDAVMLGEIEVAR
jgi:hypothetical protein